MSSKSIKTLEHREKDSYFEMQYMVYLHYKLLKLFGRRSACRVEAKPMPTKAPKLKSCTQRVLYDFFSTDDNFNIVTYFFFLQKYATLNG